MRASQGDVTDTIHVYFTFNPIIACTCARNVPQYNSSRSLAEQTSEAHSQALSTDQRGSPRTARKTKPKGSLKA